MKKLLILVAFLALGVSASASAQFRVFDPEINRQAAECAVTGNCYLNNMKMNNKKPEDWNAAVDRFAREDAENKRIEESQADEARIRRAKSQASAGLLFRQPDPDEPKVKGKGKAKKVQKHPDVAANKTAP